MDACRIEANETEKLELCIRILELGLNREIKRWHANKKGWEDVQSSDLNVWRPLEGKIDAISRERLMDLLNVLHDHDLVDLTTLMTLSAVSEAAKDVTNGTTHDDWELDGLVHKFLMGSGDAFRRLQRMVDAVLTFGKEHPDRYHAKMGRRFTEVPKHLMGTLYMKLLLRGFAAENNPEEEDHFRPFLYLDSNSMEAVFDRALETARRYQDERRAKNIPRELG